MRKTACQDNKWPRILPAFSWLLPDACGLTHRSLRSLSPILPRSCRSPTARFHRRHEPRMGGCEWGKQAKHRTEPHETTRKWILSHFIWSVPRLFALRPSVPGSFVTLRPPVVGRGLRPRGERNERHEGRMDRGRQAERDGGPEIN